MWIVVISTNPFYACERRDASRLLGGSAEIDRPN
jgi:hypothetical protein